MHVGRVYKTQPAAISAAIHNIRPFVPSRNFPIPIWQGPILFLITFSLWSWVRYFPSTFSRDGGFIFYWTLFYLTLNFIDVSWSVGPRANCSWADTNLMRFFARVILFLFHLNKEEMVNCSSTTRLVNGMTR